MVEMIMRVVQNLQMQIGEVDISQIKFDPKSRDDIPKILRGLQQLYIQLPIRTAIFKLLEEELLPPDVDKDNGREGMSLWAIFVCGVIRLDLNIDYDRLQELTNKHIDIRAMLGHGPFNEKHYHFQTLMDNVKLFTPELLDKINQHVVSEGHVLVKKRKAKRCVGVATPLSLKPMSIFQPMWACYLMPCVVSLRCWRNAACVVE
jgi:transposase, IS5 family